MIISVTQFNNFVKAMLESEPVLNDLQVRGEICNCRYSGASVYFSLKDESGSISCVMFAGQRKGLGFAMKNGDKVVAGGSVSVYERDGKYQLYARKIEQDGQGDLFLRFQKLRDLSLIHI